MRFRFQDLNHENTKGRKHEKYQKVDLVPTPLRGNALLRSLFHHKGTKDTKGFLFVFLIGDTRPLKTDHFKGLEPIRKDNRPSGRSTEGGSGILPLKTEGWKPYLKAHIEGGTVMSDEKVLRPLPFALCRP